MDVKRSTDGNSESGSKPGPDPERLKLPHEDWKEAMKKAMKKRPDDQSDRLEDDREEVG